MCADRRRLRDGDDSQMWESSLRFWRTHRWGVIIRASLPAQTRSREVGAHPLERAHLMLHVENSKNANENFLPEPQSTPGQTTEVIFA